MTVRSFPFAHRPRRASKAVSPVKVFCIGFNKTGTSSLHQYFRNVGLRSAHQAQWPHASYLLNNQSYFAEYDCYSDGERANFVGLKRWYPDAVFILNTRDTRSWLRSRIKHVLRHGDLPRATSKDIATGHREPVGHMHRQFFAGESIAIDTWLLERTMYHRHARQFFAEDPAFLEIDITTTADWNDVIGRLLSSAGVPLGAPKQESLGAANTRSENEISDQGLLQEYFDLADARIKAIGDLVGPLD